MTEELDIEAMLRICDSVETAQIPWYAIGEAVPIADEKDQRFIATFSPPTVERLLLRLRELETKYNDLIMQVSDRCTGESLHDTAKRFIIQTNRPGTDAQIRDSRE